VRDFFCALSLKEKMFSFFKKKDVAVKVDDIIWMNEERKLDALAAIATANPNTIFIAWFDETFEKLMQRFAQNKLSPDTISLAKQISKHQVLNHPIVFVEHYPLHEKEEALFQKLELHKAVVHSGLDEAFLKTFGSEKIIDLMRKLGANEEESFQHAMISSSIKNAQEKLKDKVLFERSTRSQADWIKQNLAG
jgi:hypothetical protein